MTEKKMSRPACLNSDTKKPDCKLIEKANPPLAELLLELYAAGWTQEQVLAHYPNIRPEAVKTVFTLAALCVREEVVSQFPLPTETA